jgi:hypothetical protein
VGKPKIPADTFRRIFKMGEDEQVVVVDDKLLRRLCMNGFVLVVAAKATVVAPTGVEQATLFLLRRVGFAALVTAAREVGSFVFESHMGDEEHILFLRRAGFLGTNVSKVVTAAAATFREEKLLRCSNFLRLVVFRAESSFFFLILGYEDEGCIDPSTAFRYVI